MAEGKPPLTPECVEDADGTSPHDACPVGYTLVWKPAQPVSSDIPVSELFQSSAVFVFAILSMWLLGKAVGWVTKEFRPQ